MEPLAHDGAADQVTYVIFDFDSGVLGGSWILLECQSSIGNLELGDV